MLSEVWNVNEESGLLKDLLKVQKCEHEEETGQWAGKGYLLDVKSQLTDCCPPMKHLNLITP